MKKIVERRDILSRKTYPRDELFRFVKCDGYLLFDSSYTRDGRGYYIHKDVNSILALKKKNAFTRIGKISDVEGLIKELLTYVD